jgi:ATP synthase protein I
MPPAQPDDLKRLGERIDEATRRRAQKNARKPPTSIDIATRFGTELVGAVLLGAAAGWGIDWALEHWASVHSRPWGLVAMLVLGIVAGIRNVMRAAQEINAGLASKE